MAALPTGIQIDPISLRITNIIEWLNKEFKRRIKPMEIVAGENACSILLAFVFIKREPHWRSDPAGKASKNMPFFKELAYNMYTKKLTLPPKDLT